MSKVYNVTGDSRNKHLLILLMGYYMWGKKRVKGNSLKHHEQLVPARGRVQVQILAFII